MLTARIFAQNASAKDSADLRLVHHVNEMVTEIELDLIKTLGGATFQCDYLSGTLLAIAGTRGSVPTILSL